MTIAEVERVPLDGDEYPYKHPADCPWKDNDALHRPWCRSIKGHKCNAPWGYHQHRKKIGMGGGKNPAARVVAIICPAMSQAVDNHYAIDNGKHYRDEVTNGRYRIYEHLTKRAPRLLLDKPIPGGA